jgi:nucleotide-binding universal stress UspA family protein
MINYAKIMFPLDLSPVAPVIAKHVATMVEKHNAELHVVNVVPAYDGPTFASYNQVMDEIKKNTQEAMEKFCQDNFPELKNIVIHVSVGHTGRQVLEYADKNEMDLIIMGTHGRSGLGVVFFGSVAQRVVQASTIPVLTVHPVEKEY